MDATTPPAQHGLLSALARHERGLPDWPGGGAGIRPRLPNRFEAPDSNPDTSAFDDQRAETSSALPDFSMDAPKRPGLRGGESPAVEQSPMPPAKRIQDRPSSPEPAPVPERFQDRTPDAPPRFRSVEPAAPDEKLLTHTAGKTPALPQTVATQRAAELAPQKSITEKIITVEREFQRDTPGWGSMAPPSRRQAGLMPKMPPAPLHASMARGVGPAPEPTIEIHIGRIEVRALVQAAQQKPEKAGPAAPDEGALQAYLRGRSRGARS